MPRQSRSSRGGKPARAAPRARSAPRPTRVNRAPPPAPRRDSSGGGTFFGAIAEGVAFGAGATVARRAVDALFGPPTIRSETVFTETPVVSPAPAPAPAPNTQSLGSDACNINSKAFLDCINSNENEISKCQVYMDMLVECRRNTGTTLNSGDKLSA